MSLEAKTFLSRFRIESSHFSVDLHSPLAKFHGDVIISFTEPDSPFTGLFAGLELSGKTYQNKYLRGLKGPRCKTILFMGTDFPEPEVHITWLFHELIESRFKRVILTEPATLPSPQMFVSLLVDQGLSFLAANPKTELIFTTENSPLYEHIFNVLSRQNKPQYEEGNGILDDSALLQTLFSHLQCKYCGKFSKSLKVTQCCKRLRCDECTKTRQFCSQCNEPTNMMHATFCQKMLAPVELKCACGMTGLVWRDYESHQRLCPQMKVKCPRCGAQFGREEYLLHAMRAHETEMLTDYGSVFSHKEQIIYAEAFNPPKPTPQPEESTVWECRKCGNVNDNSRVTCIKCKGPK